MTRDRPRVDHEISPSESLKGVAAAVKAWSSKCFDSTTGETAGLGETSGISAPKGKQCKLVRTVAVV